jgi:hypothetical protein
MRKKIMLRHATVIAIATIACIAQARAAEAGRVIFAAGVTQVAERAGAEGMAVQEGDLLSTGTDGFLYVKTPDNGLFILRPSTRARIAAYHIDKVNPANSRFKLELLAGVARSKSGDAVKLARQNFRFNTPVAAIGVRGTDFTVYHEHDTSRVVVFTGGIIVSGFGGGCRPEGGGPCEGAASRELTAAQRGLLLQVKRGETAPQLLSGATGPDQVSPPRSDEPLTPVLDAKKSESVAQIAPPAAQQPPPPPVVTPAPVVDVDTPPANPRALQWGRWAPLLGEQATTGLVGPAGAERILGGNFVLFRTAGDAYVAPERGSVSFSLKDGQAYIINDDPAKAAVGGAMQNGQLNVDFGARSFTTTFDLVGGGSTYKLYAQGDVASNGRIGNNPGLRPVANNMSVDGFLSNAAGGSAGYIFHSRLDDTRTANGVTYWTH